MVFLAVVLVVVAATAEVFWRFARGGAAVAEAGTVATGAGTGGADVGTAGARARAGSIAKMPPLALLVGVIGEASSLPRIVSGGSDDGGAPPNGWTKGATVAGGTRKGSTGKPERREPKFVAWWLLLGLFVLLGVGHGNMNGLNRPEACCWAAASRAGFARRLLRSASGSWT